MTTATNVGIQHNEEKPTNSSHQRAMGKRKVVEVEDERAMEKRSKIVNTLGVVISVEAAKQPRREQ